MEISREQYLEAFSKVNVKYLELLLGWVSNERTNLASFVENPTEHAEYNSYMTYDFDSLRQRVYGLGRVVQGIEAIVAYKKGAENVTETMHDYALDNIPAIIFDRLQVWLKERLGIMSVTYQSQQEDLLLPIKDYQGLASFDFVKYFEEMNLIWESIQNLSIVLDYKKQLESSE